MVAPTGYASWASRCARSLSRSAPRQARSRLLGGENYGNFKPSFDAFRIYGSGAASEGAAQADPDANLGGFRASTEQFSLAAFGAVANLTIQRIGEACDPGIGTLESDGTGLFRWTPAGATQPGPWIEVRDGQTKILHDQETSGRGLRVAQSGTPAQGGLRTIPLLELFNGAFGFDNVTNAERAAGNVEYRAVFLKNEGAAKLSIGLSTATPELSFGTETPAAGQIQTIADEDAAPIGITFGASASFDLNPGESIGLWLRRTISAGATAAARKENLLVAAVSDHARTYTLDLRGNYRIEDTTIELYELYRGDGVAPDLTAPPWETFAALPHTTAALTAGHDWYFVLRKRNRHNLVSQNLVSTVISLSGGGAQNTYPSNPSFEAAAAAGGTIRVTAAYEYLPDGANAANVWVVWLKNGADPVPGVDTPTYVEGMVRANGMALLDYTSSAFGHGSDVHVLVRALRLDDSDWQGETAYTTEYVKPIIANGYHYECTVAGTTGDTEPTWPTTPGATVVDGGVTWTCRLPNSGGAFEQSQNLTALEVTADANGPAVPDAGAFFGQAARQQD